MSGVTFCQAACNFQLRPCMQTNTMTISILEMCRYTLSCRLNSSLVGSRLFQEDILNFRTVRLGNPSLQSLQTPYQHTVQASLLTHYVLGGDHEISDNHLGHDRTPMTCGVSTGRGSYWVASWLRCLCRVAMSQYILLHVCDFFPFSLMCSVAQLRAELSHGPVLLYSTLEIF